MMDGHWNAYDGVQLVGRKKLLTVATFSVKDGDRSCLKAGSPAWLLGSLSLSRFSCWPSDAEIELDTAKCVLF